MNGRIHVRAVVGEHLHELDRPAFAIGQVFAAQAGKSSQICAAVSALVRYSIFGRMKGGS